MSDEEILIVSELLIEFRWQTCVDMSVVQPSANRRKHSELHTGVWEGKLPLLTVMTKQVKELGFSAAITLNI